MFYKNILRVIIDLGSKQSDNREAYYRLALIRTNTAYGNIFPLLFTLVTKIIILSGIISDNETTIIIGLSSFQFR